MRREISDGALAVKLLFFIAISVMLVLTTSYYSFIIIPAFFALWFRREEWRRIGLIFREVEGGEKRGEREKP